MRTVNIYNSIAVFGRSGFGCKETTLTVFGENLAKVRKLLIETLKKNDLCKEKYKIRDLLKK